MTVTRVPHLAASVCTTCCPLYCLVRSTNSTKDQHVLSPVSSELAMDERGGFNAGGSWRRRGVTLKQRNKGSND